MKPAGYFLCLLALLTLLRLWICGHSEIQPQEAYDYICSTHLDWAYYDVPAGVPALAWLSIKIFGSGAFGLRAFMPLFAFAASVFLFLLSEKHLKGWFAIFPVAAMNLLPVFNIASVRLGWEMPALAFGMLATWSIWTAFEKEHPSWPWWLLTGIATAAAIFTYLAMAAIFVAILTAVLSTRKFRHKLHGASFAAFLLPTLLLIISLFVWNRHNDWVWLATGTLSSALDISLSSFFPILQLAIWELTPLFLFLGIWELTKLKHDAHSHVRPRLYLLFTVPFVVIWAYLGLLGIDCNALLILPLSLLLIPLVQSIKDDGRTWHIMLAMASLVAAALASGWNIIQLPIESEPWRAITEEVMNVKKHNESPTSPFLIAQDADMAAILSYYVQRSGDASWDFPPVFVKESQGIDSQFSLWPRYEQFVDQQKAPDEFFTEVKATNPYMGKSALYVSNEAEPPQTIHGAFQNVQLLETIAFPTNSGETRTVWIYFCENYQTMPL